MNNLLNRAVRPLAALTIVGAIAAVAALALLALPNSKPAEAQAAANVAVDATATSVTITVTDATQSSGDAIAFSVPGYEGTNPDAETNPERTKCTITPANEGTSVFNTTSAQCRNRAGGGVFGFVQVTGAAMAYTLTISNVVQVGDTAAPSAAEITLQQASHASTQVEFGTGLPHADATVTGIGYDTSTTDSNNDPRTPDTGIPFRLPGGSDSVSVNDETTTSATILIQATLIELPEDLEGGSSIALYLEDDYDVPRNFQNRFAWFTVSGISSNGETVTQASRRSQDPGPTAGRHYVTDDVEYAEDNYFGGGDDYSLRFYIPDMRPGDTHEGVQGPKAGQTLTLTISKQAGIKNPSEAGSHTIAYRVLSPEAPEVPESGYTRFTPDLDTVATVTPSDRDAARGSTVTVKGVGFNNGVDASVFVKHYVTAGNYDANGVSTGEDPNQAYRNDVLPVRITEGAGAETLEQFNTRRAAALMSEAETCDDIINSGVKVGDAVEVGSNDQVDIEFTVSNPPFKPGDGNLLCMEDGEGRKSSSDVEFFELEPSITVTPNTVSAGQQVTVFAEDFPSKPADRLFRWVRVVNEDVTPLRSSNIGDNGKGSVTFNMPGDREGRIRIDACWGGDDACEGGNQEDTKISVKPSELTLSKTEVRANESIIIRGAGFSEVTGDGNRLISAKIGDANLVVVSDGGSLPAIEVSDSGQFSATFAIWSNADNNPALEPGEHKIVIEDFNGFTGEADITILKPTIKIDPEVAGPRDYVVISGTNWPVDNDDGGDVVDVDIEVSGGGIDPDTANEGTDANGNWSYRYRVPGDVGIPSTLTVKATYGVGEAEDISEIVTFEVPRAQLNVAPATVVPGGELTLSASGFSLYESDIEVHVGNTKVSVADGTSTDREGNLEVTVRVPALDAATYTVQLQVGGEGGTVAIGEVIVLADETGGEDALPGALDALDDNLVRVFHFNNATKIWSFYDPRPEFAELNTLSALTTGEPYWILVTETESVTLNATAHNLTCQSGDCWNSLVW